MLWRSYQCLGGEGGGSKCRPVLHRGGHVSGLLLLLWLLQGCAGECFLAAAGSISPQKLINVRRKGDFLQALVAWRCLEVSLQPVPLGVSTSGVE